MKTQEINNMRVVKVKFIYETEANGPRIKIFETNRYSDQKTQSKTFPYDPDIDETLQQAVNILERNGWDIVCRGSQIDYYVLMCDNWGENFKEIRDLK